MKRKFNLNDKIGRLSIIEFLGTDHANKRLVNCICDCGKNLIIRLNNLGRKTNSCGCLKADLIKERMGKSIEHLAVVSVPNACKRYTKETNLTFEDVNNLIFHNCFYCELSPKIVGTTYHRAIDDGRSIKRVGIDRVDSSKGYFKDNVVSCCKSCNILKRDHSVDSLIIIMETFLKNLKWLKGIINE